MIGNPDGELITVSHLNSSFTLYVIAVLAPNAASSQSVIIINVCALPVCRFEFRKFSKFYTQRLKNYDYSVPLFDLLSPCHPFGIEST